MSASPDLQTAATVIGIARQMVETATAKLAAAGGPGVKPSAFQRPENSHDRIVMTS